MPGRPRKGIGVASPRVQTENGALQPSFPVETVPVKPDTRRRLRFLAGFTLYFALLWLLWDTLFIYPLKVWVVFLHEISHAIAAVATGGSVQQITLSPYLGGACYCPGGNAFLTLTAGYLGSLAWGGLILESTRRAGRKAPSVTGALGVGTVILTLLFVRGMFGLAFGLLFGAGLIVASRRLPPDANRTLLTGLGLTSCLYAILDIKSDILDRPHLPSDAHMLGELTGIPTLAWGGLWIVVALASSAWLFMRAYRNA